MNTKKLEHLFDQYEQAADRLDMETIAGFYADNFISAGPKGNIAQSKIEFVKKAPQARDFYRNVGQKSTRIVSKQISPVSNEYTMVVVHWGMTFEKTGNKLIEFSISYLIDETGEDPKIILYISHEDEEETMKKLELLPANADEANA